MCVGTDVVSVMAAYSDLVCLCMVHCAKKYCVMGYLIDHVVYVPAGIVDSHLTTFDSFFFRFSYLWMEPTLVFINIR